VHIIAIIQARLGSTRLPGKSLVEIAGKPLLDHVVRRVEEIGGLDDFVVATSDATSDAAIAGLCNQRGWACYRGSEGDVLDRFYQAAKELQADHVLRITADCPFVCFEEAGKVIRHHLVTQADYTHNVTVFGSQMPLGTGTEIFTFAALEASWRDGKAPHHREHVDEFIPEHPERFHIERICAPNALARPEFRLTIDKAEDLELTRSIYEKLYCPEVPIPLVEVIRLLDDEPQLLEINRHVVQKRI
jgi:spore coat polysaccharide biosynthesis protein SpsF